MRFAPLILLPALVAAQSSSSSASAAAASSSASASSNSSSYLTTLLGALEAANLTSLVGVASAIANTTTGAAFLGELAVGNKTVFAPSNTAFANVSSTVASNATLLQQILSYHILNNTYSAEGIATAPAHTIARTLLSGGGFELPGNFSAPLVLSSTGNGSFDIVQAASNITVTGNATVVQNLNVFIIDEVISLPPDLASAAPVLFPSLAGIINQTGLLDPLENAVGLTIFAPNDAAVSAITSALGQLNTTSLTDILSNHVINGSVVYSTGLASGNYTSAAGEPFTFTSNATGAFVMSANTTAQIVQSDIITNFGVVHVIDQVLVNTASDPTAAASAYSSGIAAAATSTEPTTPVTATSAAATASGSSATASAGSPLALLPAGTLLAGLATAAGVMFGGSWLLL